MKRTIFTLVVSVALASPVSANQCPAMAAQIEEALATSAADDATKAQVAALLEEGLALHDAGDHAGSEARLGEAMDLLGVTMQ